MQTIKETTYKVTMTKNGKKRTVVFDQCDGVLDEIQEYVDERKADGWYFAGCEKVQVIEVSESLWF